MKPQTMTRALMRAAGNVTTMGADRPGDDRRRTRRDRRRRHAVGRTAHGGAWIPSPVRSRGSSRS